MKQHKEIEKTIKGIFLGLFAGIMFISFFYLMIGIHNIDVCHNEKVLQLTYNLSINEMSLSGKIWTLDDCYLNGVRQVYTFSIMLLISSLGTGIFVRGEK